MFQIPVQVENGDIVKIHPGKPQVYDKAPSGRLYVRWKY